jgi:hypothetical protein
VRRNQAGVSNGTGQNRFNVWRWINGRLQHVHNRRATSSTSTTKTSIEIRRSAAMGPEILHGRRGQPTKRGKGSTTKGPCGNEQAEFEIPRRLAQCAVVVRGAIGHTGCGCGIPPPRIWVQTELPAKVWRYMSKDTAVRQHSWVSLTHHASVMLMLCSAWDQPRPLLLASSRFSFWTDLVRTTSTKASAQTSEARRENNQTDWIAVQIQTRRFMILRRQRCQPGVKHDDVVLACRQHW